ncbi:MAG: iron-sulfur cluster co-chaperone HscB C-terminal domain-containing protein [Chloroherpetonaceae bacterium]|nr:iron-sulfur cluster co-chaperone HscB C-terminal domain-containing protein [Chloroherpetonaceae bacterium]
MTPIDFFSLFGLSEKIHLDTKDLQKRFYALSKEIHPDFHQTSHLSEQEASLSATARLNQAFLTLKDFDKRVWYLVNSKLGELPEVEKKKTPPELLIRLMDIRETLSEFQSTPSDLLRHSLEASLHSLQEEQKELNAEIYALGESFDQTNSEDARENLLKAIRSLMLKKNFLKSLIQTIDSTLNPSEF